MARPGPITHSLDSPDGSMQMFSLKEVMKMKVPQIDLDCYGFIGFK
jgi:hypothetical protein